MKQSKLAQKRHAKKLKRKNKTYQPKGVPQFVPSRTATDVDHTPQNTIIIS